MNRRQFLFPLCWAAAALLLAGHTPYGQWKVFRQRHLLITTSRTDPPGDALGERFVAILLADLPESRAMVSRAPHLERIASLMKTGQADFALIPGGDALALFRGDAPFSDFGPIALRVIVETDRHRLVCAQDVPLHHGYLLAATLMRHAGDLDVRVPQDSAGAIPVHPGAAAFARGENVAPPQ